MNVVKSRKLIFDFGTNILASLVVTFALQILVYPLIARSVSLNEYGIVLTIMGIVNTIVMTLGNTLNNIRLLQNQSYESIDEQGDFNIILLLISALGAISIIIIMLAFKHIGLVDLILLTLTVIFGILKSYCLVGYRLKLKFKLNLYCNLVIGFGYTIGLLLFHLTKVWVLIFLIGEIFGCIFLLFTTEFLKEPIKITVIFKQTMSRYMLLIVNGIMATALTYMDRLIIFPLLGGAAVSTFTVASFFGKSIGLIMVPIAGVLLGYYAQRDFKFTRKIFWSINFYVLVFLAIFFGISIVSSYWFTGLLYPTLIKDAKPYIFVANLASIIGIASSMTQPAVLRFAPMFWQIIIQVIYSILYVGVGIFMLKAYGIYGFSVGIIIANVARLLLLYGIGDKYVRQAAA